MLRPAHLLTFVEEVREGRDKEGRGMNEVRGVIRGRMKRKGDMERAYECNERS